MTNPTRVSERSNDNSDEIERVHDNITTVIPRDTSVSTERYIIFVERLLPPDALDKIDNLGYNIRHMDDHAIDYEHKDTRERASYLAYPT